MIQVSRWWRRTRSIRKKIKLFDSLKPKTGFSSRSSRGWENNLTRALNQLANLLLAHATKIIFYFLQLFENHFSHSLAARWFIFLSLFSQLFLINAHSKLNYSFAYQQFHYNNIHKIHRLKRTTFVEGLKYSERSHFSPTRSSVVQPIPTHCNSLSSMLLQSPFTILIASCFRFDVQCSCSWSDKRREGQQKKIYIYMKLTVLHGKPHFSVL